MTLRIPIAYSLVLLGIATSMIVLRTTNWNRYSKKITASDSESELEAESSASASQQQAAAPASRQPGRQAQRQRARALNSRGPFWLLLAPATFPPLVTRHTGQTAAGSVTLLSRRHFHAAAPRPQGIWPCDEQQRADRRQGIWAAAEAAGVQFVGAGRGPRCQEAGCP